jgi:hypothetical protein
MSKHAGINLLWIAFMFGLQPLIIYSQEKIKETPNSPAADGCKIFEKSVERYTFSKIENIDIDLPKAVELQKKRGIDASYWRFTNSDIEVTLYFGRQTPSPNGYESQLPTFNEKQDEINGILTWLWHYRDPDAKLPWVSAARYYLKGTVDGEAVTIYMRTKCSDLFEMDEAIIRSFRRRV